MQKKIMIGVLVLFLALSGMAVATSYYNWGQTDLMPLLASVFDTDNGHNHDGTNSRLITTVASTASGAKGYFNTLTMLYANPTQYFSLYVYEKLKGPASGAKAGSVIAIKDGYTANDCGITGGTAGTSFNVCVSDGTNWKSLT